MIDTNFSTDLMCSYYDPESEIQDLLTEAYKTDFLVHSSDSENFFGAFSSHSALSSLTDQEPPRVFTPLPNVTAEPENFSASQSSSTPETAIDLTSDSAQSSGSPSSSMRSSPKMLSLHSRKKPLSKEPGESLDHYNTRQLNDYMQYVEDVLFTINHTENKEDLKSWRSRIQPLQSSCKFNDRVLMTKIKQVINKIGDRLKKIKSNNPFLWQTNSSASSAAPTTFAEILSAWGGPGQSSSSSES